MSDELTIVSIQEKSLNRLLSDNEKMRSKIHDIELLLYTGIRVLRMVGSHMGMDPLPENKGYGEHIEQVYAYVKKKGYSVQRLIEDVGELRRENAKLRKGVSELEGQNKSLMEKLCQSK